MNEGIETKIDLGFVLISGAGLPSSIWDEVRNSLNLPSIAIQYPDQLASGRKRSEFSIQDYSNQVMSQITQANFKNVILVCHSIGGLVGLVSADFLKTRAHKMIAVGAAIPKSGKSVLSTSPLPLKILGRFLIDIFGTVPPKKVILKTLCNDLPEAVGEKIAAEYTAESRQLYYDPNPVGNPACKKVYVMLTQDHALSPKTQETMAANFGAQKIRSLDTGHLPMLADPKGLAKILNDVF